ncbi:hypothetical protein LI82_01825 [Methanococcoides methylutens]|uniref:Uncharacterized protein n=1 Tax=Methanococcoides methylutens TaxID=2226 RepID=A0A099T5P3_METMT|nr:hypothetical protein [Methanococcoides methylutens]KGK99516.1 hypothetical protein LI82_01825 [Methanococcoides methylutens]
MSEKTVFDQYKEMVEKTKQLHSELVVLSSKVGGMVDTMDSGLPGSVSPAQGVTLRGSDINAVNGFGNHSSKSASLKGRESDIND